MRTVPRPKPSRERVATPAELEEDRRRWLAAKAKIPTQKPAQVGNLCSCLVTFAAWRRCSACGATTLYVSRHIQTDSEFACGACMGESTALANRLKRGSLASRVVVRLRGLFAVGNDNHLARA